MNWLHLHFTLFLIFWIMLTCFSQISIKKGPLARFLIFSRIFMTCFDEDNSCFYPMSELSKPDSEDIASLMKVTIKPIFDTIKRKSTIFRKMLIFFERNC